MKQVWYDQIVSRLPESRNIPITTVFTGVFLPEHKLIVHFISLDSTLLGKCSPDYFASLTTQSELMGLRCVHVWEDVYLTHPDLVTERLLALTGIRKRIHGRATTVKRIDQPTAKTFLNQHHLQGYVNAYYKYALFKDDTIVAVATFSKSRVMQDGVVPYRSYELIRFASLTGYTVTGGLGKLLNRFVDDLHPAHIMTYADRDWGDGAGYRKLGFKQVAITEPILFYVDEQTHQRHPAPEIIKGKTPVYNSGNIKYVLDNRSPQ